VIFFDLHAHVHTLSVSLSFSLLIDLTDSTEDSGSCKQDNSQIGPDTQEPDRKRRPGRPRGSKNRKTRVGSSRQEGGFYYQGQLPSSVGPPHLSDINSQNHQYYEFQWRVLNLCAEFYGAAEELVVGRNHYICFLTLSLPVCVESNASAGCCSVLSYGSERQSGSINDVVGSKACV